MEPSLIVRGGRALNGEIVNDGAKNASLPIMAATVLSDGPVTISGVPECSDVKDMLKLLSNVDRPGRFDKGVIAFSQSRALGQSVLSKEARRIRHSFDLAGPLLARLGRVIIAPPGGCDLGHRPVNFHLDGFAAMGASWKMSDDGAITISARSLSAATIKLPYPSVGATLNLMMAATKAEGETVIVNAARDPEVRDVANYLRTMGACITGDGGETIRVRGPSDLHAADHRVMSDRINAGTFLAMGVACAEELTITNVPVESLTEVISLLRGIGADLRVYADRIRVSSAPIHATNISTGPYPGFPTDLQPVFTALLATAPGESILEERVFERRFSHVDPLRTMGARIDVDGSLLRIRGTRLTAAHLGARDIRGGAALLIAALATQGASTISGVHHLRRGYPAIEEKLSMIGADVVLSHTA